MLGQPSRCSSRGRSASACTGKLPRGVTATDLVLTVTQMLRKKGVVGKFVEFFGPASTTCRSPTAPPSPTWRPNTARPAASSPSTTRDARYLDSGRRRRASRWSRKYAKAQGAAHRRRPTRCSPTLWKLDLATVGPVLAGPKRPQDRVARGRRRTSQAPSRRRATAKARLLAAAPRGAGQGGNSRPRPRRVVIAAITSCTNTSNPRA